MPWLPEVQALTVGMMRPREPEEHAHVHRRGVAHHLDVGGGVEAADVLIDQHLAEVGDALRRRADGRAVGHAHAAAVMTGSPSRPASISASSVARVAISATRPMLRVVLRL